MDSDKEIDNVLAVFDTLLKEGEFEAVNWLLSVINVSKVGTASLYAICNYCRLVKETEGKPLPLGEAFLYLAMSEMITRTGAAPSVLSRFVGKV